MRIFICLYTESTTLIKFAISPTLISRILSVTFSLQSFCLFVFHRENKCLRQKLEAQKNLQFGLN